MILEIKGGTSTLQLYDDYLIIKPAGILSGAHKTIPLASIVAVNIVKPLMKKPYLQIVTPDITPQKNDAMQGANANVVLIRSGNMPKVEQLQAYVSQYKANGCHPAAAVNTAPSPAAEIDALKQLAELKEQGVITQEEFEAKKTQLLHL